MSLTPIDEIFCPACKSAKNLKYLWPSTQKPGCVEAHMWRFQRCTWCGWTGDILTGHAYLIERAGLAGYFIDKRFYASLDSWFEELGLCP